jgi:hypothetical protein
VSKKDQIRIGQEVGPNTRLVERRKNGRTSIGTLTPMKDGQSLLTGAEIVKVALDEDDEWHDVETIYAPEPALSGPPQVATPAYKKGYDRIFGKQKVGLA